ncbi:Fanconi anemia group D2 protein [Haplosporangium sp. Z 27]|nr:Fanconi anemia group D2 protein [Haplosporangium sp. Z 27]
MTLAAGPVAFYSICQQSGLTLGTNGSQNVLHVDPSRFQRDAARSIQRSQSSPGYIDSFLESLRDHLEDPLNLKSCLVPISAPGTKGSSFPLGESLIRILLGIDILQPGLMDLLLDRIFDFLNEDDKESSIPKLILQQLKWLNNIIEPAQLTSKLLEVIGMSPVSIQRDIITSLPEIVPDSEHRPVVLGLVELMENSSELMVPILDALSNLNLQSEVLVNARNHVMDKLESAELDDLPIVIKFLLQTVEADTVGEVIETIRANLDFESINKLQKNSKQKSKSRTPSQTPEVLILDALRSGIRFQKFVTDAWYKALVAIPKASQHKVIDVMVILVMHSIVSLKKKVEVLIRKKIIEGLLTRKLLEETILTHGFSLREYMPAVLSISENLLRSSTNHPIVARAASTLYTCSFQVSDSYYRQEIVGSLLTHIGSGSAVEIDASLAVLHNILNVSRTALNEFSIFIKGVLDYLDNLTLEQIRLLFVLLGLLAREDELSGNSGTLLTDLNILIRKQLSNPLDGFKKIGVMGAIAMVQAFGVQEKGSSERGSSSQAVVSHHQAEVCLALTYDELATMVLSGDLDPKLVLWIKEEFSNQFAGTFVCAANETFSMKPNRNIAMERWMNLDGPESELSIAIMPCLCADMTEASSQGASSNTADEIVVLCSLFKLLQATEKSTGENGLDDIDGLLGCGITMFKKDYLEDIAEVYSTEICHAIAQGLLCAINWFREISNAFSYDASDQTMARVIVRLQQISELEQMLRHILKSVPGFRPLEASHVKSKDSTRGTTGTANALSIQSTNITILSQKLSRGMEIDSRPKPLIVHSNEIVTYESLAPYLREFEVDVFHVLRVIEPIKHEVLETPETSQVKNVQLQYPELLFLLKDLFTKISFKLPAPVTHTPFGKKVQSSVVNNNTLLVRMNTKDFVYGVLKVVPFIVTKTRLMLSLLYSDEEVSDQNGEPVDTSIILECLNISLRVILALLSWNEIKGSDQKELRLDLLKSLAIDRKTGNELLEIQNSINLSAIDAEAFANLSTWREMMPNFESSVLLLEVLDKLLDLVPRNQETSVKASKLATEVLSYRWPSSNTIKPDRLTFVLGQQVGRSNVRLEMINEYVTGVLPSFLDQDEGSSELHPMLTANTFTIYTKVLHIQLAVLAGEFSEDDFDTTQAALDHISGLCLCFQKLASFVKSNDKREVLGVTLKHSKVFMEQFIKRVLPFLGLHFRGHQDAVAKLFKNHLQNATRSLQNVCGHAKASREQTLMVMVPAIKKTMESLIFEVKLMLENNDAGAAFWLGNLKHRNLRGEEISSQLPEISDDEMNQEPEEDEIDELDSASDEERVSIKKKTKKRARPSSSSKEAKSGKNPKQSKKQKLPKAKADSRSNTLGGEDEARIHTKSDMSDDEDQLADDNEDIREKKSKFVRSRGNVENEEDADELEEEDEYADRMLELQDERAEKRRRVRNPYIDDAAMEDDEEEEEDDEEEEEEEEEEEDEDEEEEEEEQDEDE